MPNETIRNEILIEQKVTYTLEMDGKFFLFFLIENVPARVNVETGEQYFSPKTVDRLQQVVWKGNPLELLHYRYMNLRIRHDNVHNFF